MMPDRSFRMMLGKRRWYCIIGMVNLPFVTKCMLEKKTGKVFSVILKTPPYKIRCPWVNFMDAGLMNTERRRFYRRGRIHRFGFRGAMLSENPQDRYAFRSR